MSEVYKIGIGLLMTSNHAQVLGLLSQQLLGVHANVNQLTGAFKGLKLAIGSALAVDAGMKLLGVTKSLVEHGSKIVHQQELMRAAGASNLEIQQATAKAYETSARVQTTTIAENLKHLRELKYAFGDIATAQKYLDPVSKAQAILESTAGTKGNSDQVWALVKAFENKGLTADPESFKRYIDRSTQIMVATGGRVTPQMLFQTFKYGRTAMLGWDENFIFGALPRLMQSLGSGGGGGGGSGGPGNALMSTFSHIIGGQMSAASADALNRLGLIDPTKMRAQGGGAHHGLAKSFKVLPGGVKGSDLLIANPYEWDQQVLAPAAIAKYGHDPKKIIEGLGPAFRNRTEGQVLIEFLLQGRTFMGADSPYEKDIRLQKQPLHLDEAYASLLRQDPTMRMRAFNQQWDSLLEAMGSALVPTGIAVMGTLTDVFTKLANVNPNILTGIAVGITALAGALVAGGVAGFVALLAMGGPVVLGITAVTGAIIALVGALALWKTSLPRPKDDPKWGASHEYDGHATRLGRPRPYSYQGTRTVDPFNSYGSPYGAGGPNLGALGTERFSVPGVAPWFGNNAPDKPLGAFGQRFTMPSGSPWVGTSAPDYLSGSPVPHDHPYNPRLGQYGQGLEKSIPSLTDETAKNTDALKRSTDALMGLINYRGGGVGSGGGLINAAFHPANSNIPGFHSGGGFNLLPNGIGGFGGGNSLGGSFARGGIPGLGLGFGGNNHHGIGLGGKGGVTGSGGDFLSDGIGAGRGGSAFLKERRAKFRDQLAKTPGLRDEVLGMMQTEGSGQPTVESLFNRSDMTGKSLHSMLHSGFYGPINRGQLPGAISALHRNPKLYNKLNKNLEDALNGSHVIGGYTDQGMPTDPNGHLSPRGRGHQYMHLGGNDFTDWVGRNNPRSKSEAYRRFVEKGLSTEATAGLHGSALRAHFGHLHKAGTDDASGSPAIPPHHGQEHTYNNIIHLDGQVVAKNTMKHMVNAGNRAAGGARLTDTYGTRPLAV
jgi:hypothetical protein